MSSSRSSSGALAASSKEKEPFKVRAELYAPTRLTPKAFAMFRLRALVVDVIAHECLVLVLLAARTALTASAIRHGAGSSGAPAQLPRVGILGGGHVGSAVALALLQHNYPTERVAISTRQPERAPKCDALQSPQAQALFHSVPKYYDNARLARESDVLVLCMPPSQLKSVAIQLKHALSVSAAPTLVLSALCGVSRELLQKSCGSRLVARANVGVAELGGASALPSEARLAGEAVALQEDSTASVSNEESVVDVTARELARDAEQLAQVLTDWGLRSSGEQVAEDSEAESFLEEAIRQQVCASMFAAGGDTPLVPLAQPWVSGWDDLVVVTLKRGGQDRLGGEGMRHAR
ncbi:hypothetical protein PybrP1_005837 [[Pythium] brassicae (nom. inval.)]|nr:hypothetical protein PybrP1_005837 [[Pythium] brassicae (nom. inval.)]